MTNIFKNENRMQYFQRFLISFLLNRLMRVAIYARVSTDDKGQDVENQLMQLRDYCKAKNYTIVKEYTEYITGTGKKRRPVFEEMMEDARKRKFDILLVWSYDRFSRAGLKDIHYINDLNEW
jgi:DNA invertase Pin-like site-specific DNA recombinase